MKSSTKFILPGAVTNFVLITEEVILRKGLKYASINDSFVGFHQNRTDLPIPKIANHAPLIMIRVLKTSWKLPVFHFFFSVVTNSEDLAKIVQTVIIKLSHVSLRVRAEVCDQGSTDHQAMSLSLNKNKTNFCFLTAYNPILTGGKYCISE